MASCVYIAEPLGAVTDVQTVLNSVKDVIDKDAVKPYTLQCLVPSSTSDTDVYHLPSISEWFVSLCRHYRLMANPRFTVLSHCDMAHVVQLGVAEKNKLAGGTYDAVDEVVLEMLEKICQMKLTSATEENNESDSDLRMVLEYYKTFLTSSNHVDLFDVYTAVAQETGKESDLQKDLAATVFCCFGTPSTELEKKMFQLLCADSEPTSLQLSRDSCNSESEVSTMESESLSENLNSQDTDDVYTTAQMFIYKTILSYLHLLVNTRSELALSRIFNIPNRDLNHTAFTVVKREARKKNLPMYQTLTSFVMRLRLGGKGYAPDKSSPLLPHVKGFSLLMGMIQKLQGIVEEEPDISSACRCVVKVIKKNLLECTVCKFRKQDLDVVAEKILSRIAAIVDHNERKAAASPDKPASEGGSLTGRRSLRVLQQLLDWTASCLVGEDTCAGLHLDSIALNPNTPTRIPSLLSQFRSPVISDNSPVKPVKQTGLKNSNKRQSDRDVVLPGGEKLRQRDLDAVVILPSKTLVAASEDTQQRLKGLSISSQDKENIFHHNPEEQKPSKKAKFTLSSPGMTVSNVNKKVSKTQTNKKKPAAKSCRRRLLPQVEGQKQITSFFRI